MRPRELELEVLDKSLRSQYQNKHNSYVFARINVINYILVLQDQKQTLMDARSYAGAETSSDHKIVKMTMVIKWTELYRRPPKQETVKRLDSTKLVNDEATREAYRENVDERIQELVGAGALNWENMQTELIKAAEETVGYQTNTRVRKIQDPELEAMSNQQQKLRLEIENCKEADQIQKLKKARKSILNKLSKAVAKRKEEEIDKTVSEICEIQDDARMYAAVRYLNKNRPENTFVHDKDGRCVTNRQSMYEIINNHFKAHFQKQDVLIVEPFKESEPKRLNRPLTGTEIKKTARCLKNGKSTADIPAELIKYGPDRAHSSIATVLNNMLEKQEDIDIGRGTLLPIQKPKPKQVGPVKNLRPITLLRMIRKVFSRTTTTRITPKTKTYLSHSQRAYKEGASTADIVWSYRWILAKVQEIEIKIYIVGIDMSSAFDTIDRNKLVQILETFLDEDEVRMVRRLLSKTTLEVRVKGAKSEPFESNIGSPQGGSVSGPLFEIYFENSLKDVRGELESFKIHIQIHTDSNNITETALPDEIIYADDCDFITTDIRVKQFLNQNADRILLQHNLLVNTDKTENTTLQRHPGKKGAEKEEWRKVKKVGSLLGDREDIARRKQLSTVSLRKLNSLWIRKKAKVERRVKLYNSLVRSILLYNCGTWGMSKSDEDKIDSFHRQHLRQILNIKYPNKIKSKHLYKTTRQHAISTDITKARWKLFGHTLRMHKDTPARKAMKFYFEQSGAKKFKGRKRTTIVNTLNRDITNTKQIYPQFDLPKLNSELDLHNIRVKAQNRVLWRKRVKMIYDAAYSLRMRDYLQ